MDRKDKKIVEADDFNEYCEFLLDDFCCGLEGDERYTRPLNDEEKELYSAEYPTTTFMYKNRGSEIVERYISRLFKVGIRYFDEFDLQIKTSWFVDLE